jgi:hypothetical protein
MEPVRFERVTKKEAPKACLVYLVGVPALAFFVWIVVMTTVHATLTGFGVSDQTAGGVNACLLPLVFAAMLRWGIRDYRRGGRAVLVVSDDRIDLDSPRQKGHFEFDVLRTIQLKPYDSDLACVLVPKQGKPCPLPPDFASFDKVRATFESALVPRFVQRFDEQIAAGQGIGIKDSAGRGLLRMVWGVLMIPLGIAGVCSLFLADLGFSMLVGAPHRIRQGWRGLSGGFEIRSGGLVPRSGMVRKTVGWELLSLENLGADGLVLRSRRGGTLTLSPTAEDFWPASRWIAARLSKPAP